MVPKINGYKTLAVAFLTAMFGIANILYPEFQAPQPETVVLVVDQLAGAIIAVMGLVFAVLRVVTYKPVLDREREQPASQDHLRLADIGYGPDSRQTPKFMREDTDSEPLLFDRLPEQRRAS